eukprot:766055-Hanusia_phi.AAC.14
MQAENVEHPPLSFRCWRVASMAGGGDRRVYVGRLHRDGTETWQSEERSGSRDAETADGRQGREQWRAREEGGGGVKPEVVVDSMQRRNRGQTRIGRNGERCKQEAERGFAQGDHLQLWQARHVAEKGSVKHSTRNLNSTNLSKKSVINLEPADNYPSFVEYQQKTIRTATFPVLFFINRYANQTIECGSRQQLNRCTTINISKSIARFCLKNNTKHDKLVVLVATTLDTEKSRLHCGKMQEHYGFQPINRTPTPKASMLNPNSYNNGD